MEVIMEKITAEQAIRLLKNSPIENAMHIDSIRYFIEDEENAEYYRTDNVLIFADITSKGTYVNVVPFTGEWNMAEFEVFLHEKYTQLSVLVDVQKLNDNEKQKCMEVFGQSAHYDRTFVNYGFTGTVSAEKTNPAIVLLTPEDEERFLAMENTPEPYRPPLNVLFKMFVHQKHGSILAYVEDNRIIGYLSYNTLYDNICDVDFVYVSPSQRGRGIGGKLAAAYTDTVSRTGGIPFWSNAKNEASEHTAENAGFAKVTEAYRFID